MSGPEHLAQAGYEAYRLVMEHAHAPGLTLPAFADLDRIQRRAWTRAIETVLAEAAQEVT